MIKRLAALQDVISTKQHKEYAENMLTGGINIGIRM